MCRANTFDVIVCFCGEERLYLGERFARCKVCKRWLIRNFQLAVKKTW